MNNVLGAACGPYIEIAVIEDLRARAESLTAAMQPYVGRASEDVPRELRQQIHGLAHEASRLVAEAIKRLKADGWHSGLTLGRNHYHYRRQAVWMGPDDEDQYVSYDSRLALEASEVIWDASDWDFWSPPYGVKRDFVTFYGAPGIVNELASGTILDDMAAVPVVHDDLPAEARSFWQRARGREDTYPGHHSHSDEQSALETAEMQFWEPEERVHDDYYRD